MVALPLPVHTQVVPPAKVDSNTGFSVCSCVLLMKCTNQASRGAYASWLKRLTQVLKVAGVLARQA